MTLQFIKPKTYRFDWSKGQGHILTNKLGQFCSGFSYALEHCRMSMTYTVQTAECRRVN